MIRKKCLNIAWRFSILLFLIPLFFTAFVARFVKKPIDVGFGPEPIISNVYFKEALIRYGYTAETFVTSLNYITSDYDRVLYRENVVALAYYRIVAFIIAIFRYKCLYIYFTGGPFGRDWLIWRFEAALFKLAGVKIVVMPYGSDVQDMTLSPNLSFRHTYARQYRANLIRRKSVAARVDYWSRHAHHIIATGGLVYFMHVWDTLMPSYLSIDTEIWRPTSPPRTTGSFKILHAPNHRHIKGTQYIIDAVEELRASDLDIELILLEGVRNDEIRARMEEVDIVADQLIIGWYAMFALEGMAMEKPVLCYLRDDLKDLYVTTGLVGPDEIPIVECRPDTVKETIERLYRSREELGEIGRRSRAFVERHHSLDAVGAVFDRINRSIGVPPSAAPTEMSEHTAGDPR